MDKLKQYSSINPLAKSKRMARSMNRMIQPIPKIDSAPKQGWSTCSIKDCNSIFTRERDLIRHRRESQQFPV